MKALAAIRVQKFASMATIRAAEAHGRRQDEASAKRVDVSRTVLNLAASRYSPDDPLALEAAFRAFKKATGAVEGKGASVMAHTIAVISPEVLAEAGDPRDPDNPKVRALFDQAQAWARTEFGEESLIAARLDVDEKGAGVVDLYLAPTAMQSGGRGRKPKLTISVKSALEGISAREKARQGLEKAPRSFSALQDSWGRWAGEKIDSRLKRGKPKLETQRQHVHSDVLREREEELIAREADLKAREQRLASDEARTRQQRQRTADRLRDVRAWERQLRTDEAIADSYQAVLEERYEEVQEREGLLNEERTRLIEWEAAEKKRLEAQASSIREFTQAFAAGEVSRVAPSSKDAGTLTFFRPNNLPDDRKERLAALWSNVPDALRQVLASLTSTRKNLLEEGRKQGRREGVEAFNGLLAAWADKEVEPNPDNPGKGEWRFLCPVDETRMGVLAGWVRTVGLAVERIVSALTERLGALVNDLEERKRAARAVEIEEDWDDSPSPGM